MQFSAILVMAHLLVVATIFTFAINQTQIIAVIQIFAIPTKMLITHTSSNNHGQGSVAVHQVTISRLYSTKCTR
jgi:hypothetical protein